MKIGSDITASAKADDPDGDSMTYRRAICGDDIRKDEKTRNQARVDRWLHQSAQGRGNHAKSTRGARKLSVVCFFTDGKGHGATANVPFCVER